MKSNHKIVDFITKRVY